MREVGATANSQPVKDEHQYVVADFEYEPGHLMRIAEPRRRLPPIGEQLPVDYLPEKPDNAQLHVTTVAFLGAVALETLVGLAFLIPTAGLANP